MAYRMIPNVKLWRHIRWRHSYLNFKILIEIFKESWKLKTFLQYHKYELRSDILNLDKFVAQKQGTPL